MKKSILILFLFFSLSSFSQSSDLASLSTGTYAGSTGIYEKSDALFGYIIYYDYGLVDKFTKKMEYVILDKNLNKVANNVFETEKYVSNYNVTRINHKREIKLRPNIDYSATSIWNYKDQKMPQTRKINLEKNEISLDDDICFKDKKFSDCPKDLTYRDMQKEAKEERKKDLKYKSDVVIMEDGTYLVYEYYIDGDKISDNSYIKFDKDNKEIWRYEFNKDLKKKQYENTSVLNFDQENLYMVQTFYEKSKTTSMKFLRLDIKTGNVIVEIPITNFDAFDLNNIYNLKDSNGYSVGNKKVFDDKLVFLGRSYEKNRSNGAIGFYRFLFDKKTNTGTFEILKYTDALTKTDIKIEKNGGLSGSFFLAIRDVYILADGTVNIMFEKIKYGNNGRSVATDLILFKTDINFVINEVKIFEKAKSVNETSDYLFSQYLNNDKDLVFFYRDYEKDDGASKKNWNLYINTIKNGVFNQEKIVISSKKDFFIIPSLAKEGYVLLREYNKDYKHNEVRLERLNY
ncbi:MAG: hypothetical protein IM568_12225 [Flavobacterium sp.]|nr:hypothetical protein [Flavobacterium sp.]